LPQPRVTAEHLAFVEGEHARVAHRLLRSLRRVRALEASSGIAARAPSGIGVEYGSAIPAGATAVAISGGASKQGQHAPVLSGGELACAERLWSHFGGAVPLDGIKGEDALRAAVAALHSRA